VDQTLGNVMGLNPFHDFEAWETLKLLQQLTDIEVPALTVKQEMEAWIEDARRRAGLQSIL
jgi:FKBP-type peptidyl-prolyl cis-trans isomerase (trigger factor)